MTTMLRSSGGLVVAFLLHSTSACLPPPGDSFGPFFQNFPSAINDNPYLWTTLSDDSILLGKLSRYSNSSMTSEIDVTISLLDGSIVEGWPDDAEPNMPPPTLVDPSGGATDVAVAPDGSSVTLVLQGDMAFNLDLELPAHYTGVVDPSNRVFYFIEDQIAYFFYAGSFDCANPDAASIETECENCAACTFEENYFSAALNLRTAEVIATGQPFLSRYGLDVFEPGALNSVTTVYPDIQLANVGQLDSCGGTGYLMYNPNGTMTQLLRFDPGNLYAAATTQYEAYAISQTERSAETRYVESFEVQKFSMITGVTLSTIPLDTDALWALTGMERPMKAIAPPTPPPFDGPIVPITIRVPTPSPGVSTTAPISGAFSVDTAPPTMSVGGTFTNAPVTTLSVTPTTLQPSTTMGTNIMGTASPTTSTTGTLDPTTTTTGSFVPGNGTFASMPPTPTPGNNMTFSPSFMIPANTTEMFPQCSSNEACAALALIGDCCPTIQSVNLECCQMGDIELNCPDNARCAAEDLEGACCPTSDGEYLDCCEVVPDDCGAESSDCVILLVADYKARQAQSAAVTATSVLWTAIASVFVALKLN